MGTCHTCLHSRPARRNSEALAEDCSASRQRAVEEALGKIRDEENRLEAAELKHKKDLLLRSEAEWGLPPRRHDYCGVHEARQVYYVRELKNAGERCRDYQRGERPVRTCASCAHRSPPFGQERDLGIAQAYSATIVWMPMFQSANQERLKQHENACAQATANQIMVASFGEGPPSHRPEYLSVCKAQSIHGQSYAVCAVINANNACLLWQRSANGNQDAATPVLELSDGQLEFADAGGYRLNRDGFRLRIEYPDPDLGPPKRATFDLRTAPADGAAQLALPDGTALPLLVRSTHAVTYVRVGQPPPEIRFPLMLPQEDAPRTFRARPEKYYKHPNPRLKFSLRVSGHSLVIVNGYGATTNVDLGTIPTGQWISPHDHGLRYPLKVRIGRIERMTGVWAPEVEWLD